MARKRLLFVGDGGSPAALGKLLDDVDVIANTRSIPVSVPTARRHLAYLRMAAATALSARNYDKIFIWQQFVAVYYCLFAVALFRRTPFLVYCVIGKQQPGIIGAIKTRLFLMMVRSRSNVMTYFMTGADYIYRLVQDAGSGGKCSIRNALDTDTRFLRTLRRADGIGDYVFSGGASNRDYRDLVALARGAPEQAFVIACRPENIRHLDLPANLTPLTEAYGHDFDRLVAGARLVVIPVSDPDVMSGQLVCIQAFAAGKPVLFRRNNFLADWLPDAERLPFLRQYADIAELRAIVAALDDDQVRALGRQARAFYEAEIRGSLLFEGFARDIRATAWRRRRA